jgi:diguanylate cyclase
MIQELQRWQRFGHPVCVAVWDVDHFKRINDTYGHRAGDRVLCSVADYLKNHSRSTDFVARYGGEEFVMILTGTQINNAMPLLEKTRIAIGKLGFHYSGEPVSITVSCGVTELKQGDSAETVFERADKALYQAKNNGRNQCVSG